MAAPPLLNEKVVVMPVANRAPREFVQSREPADSSRVNAVVAGVPIGLQEMVLTVWLIVKDSTGRCSRASRERPLALDRRTPKRSRRRTLAAVRSAGFSTAGRSARSSDDWHCAGG